MTIKNGSIRFCEIVIEGPDEAFMESKPLLVRIGVDMQSMAAAVALINKSGMTVSSIREFTAYTPEEFFEAHAKWLPVLGAILKKSSLEEEAETPKEA